MGKRIKGRLYDTDTARVVGRWDGGAVDEAGLLVLEEALHCKTSGEYFLHGRGGEGTPYAVRRGIDSWEVGEDVIPLTEDEAKVWAERHLPDDAYEAEWDAPEDGEAVPISAKVSPAAKRALEAEARRTGEKQTQIIDRLLLGLQRD